MTEETTPLLNIPTNDHFHEITADTKSPPDPTVQSNDNDSLEEILASEQGATSIPAINPSQSPTSHSDRANAQEKFNILLDSANKVVDLYDGDEISFNELQQQFKSIDERSSHF